MNSPQAIAAFIETRAQQYRADKRQGDAVTLEAIASDIRAGLHEMESQNVE